MISDAEIAFRHFCPNSGYWDGGHDTEFSTAPNATGFYRCLFCDKAIIAGDKTMLLLGFVISEQP